MVLKDLHLVFDPSVAKLFIKMQRSLTEAGLNDLIGMEAMQNVIEYACGMRSRKLPDTSKV